MENKPVIIPANDLPTSNMKLRMSSANGMLTLEFEKSVSYLQFNSVDAKRLVNGMIAQINAMESN